MGLLSFVRRLRKTTPPETVVPVEAPEETTSSADEMFTRLAALDYEPKRPRTRP